MEWTIADEQRVHDLEWKDARRRMPFLRRWKVMTNSKADNAYWKIVRYYAGFMPLIHAVAHAHDEMRELYGMAFNKQTRSWQDIPVAWRQA
jgi:hypothetical protein